GRPEIKVECTVGLQTRERLSGLTVNSRELTGQEDLPIALQEQRVYHPIGAGAEVLVDVPLGIDPHDIAMVFCGERIELSCNQDLPIGLNGDAVQVLSEYLGIKRVVQAAIRFKTYERTGWLASDLAELSPDNDSAIDLNAQCIHACVRRRIKACC